MNTSTTDPVAALKAAENAELERVRETYRAHQKAAAGYAEGTKLRDQAVTLDDRGRTLQATAVADLLTSGMTAAEVGHVVGLTTRQVRETAKHSPTATSTAPTT